MIVKARYSIASILFLFMIITANAQKNQFVKVVKDANENKVDIFVGQKLFTSFLYPDTLEKPVLYPLRAANGTVVTRGFPLNPKPGDPTDHPHHIGLWFNYENVNGLDFWNNSYAIPKEKKNMYGWIKTDKVLETKSGDKGCAAGRNNEVLIYRKRSPKNYRQNNNIKGKY